MALLLVFCASMKVLKNLSWGVSRSTGIANELFMGNRSEVVSLPTDAFSQSIPTLPLPPLHKTLESLHQLIHTPNYSSSLSGHLKNALEAYESNEGAKVQEEIRRTMKVNTHTSYVISDQLEEGLCQREGFLALPSDWHVIPLPFCSMSLKDTATQSSLVIHALLRWQEKLHQRVLPPPLWNSKTGRRIWWNHRIQQQTIALTPPRMRRKCLHLLTFHQAEPIDLHLYDYIFNTTRTPGAVMDQWVNSGRESHIIVSCRGHLFCIELSSEILCLEEIYSHIHGILSLSQSSVSHDVAALTSLPRQVWSKARTSLLRNPTNACSLRLIESAAFFFVLNDIAAASATASPSFPWLDKGLVVRMGADTVEIASSIGTSAAIQLLCEDVSRCLPKLLPILNHTPLRMQPLQWALGDSERQLIEYATIRQRHAFEKEDISTMTVVPSFVSGSGKYKGKLFLEGVLQLCTLQGFFNACNCIPAVVEPVLMSTFRRGWVDYMPLNTTLVEEIIAFKSQSADVLLQRALAAVENYGKRKDDTTRGFGVHSHLVGLRSFSERLYSRHSWIFDNELIKHVLQGNVLSSISYLKDVTVYKPVHLSHRSAHIHWNISEKNELTLVVNTRKNSDFPSAKEIGASVVDTYNTLFSRLS